MSKFDERIAKVADIIRKRTQQMTAVLTAYNKTNSMSDREKELADILNDFGCHKEKVVALLKFMDVADVESTVTKVKNMPENIPLAVVVTEDHDKDIPANTPIIIVGYDCWFFDKKVGWSSTNTPSRTALKSPTPANISFIVGHLEDGDILFELENQLEDE